MKKLITSKPFIAGALAVLCISILSVCIFWGKGKQTVFLPDEPIPLGSIESWTENHALTDETNGIETETVGYDLELWVSNTQPWQQTGSQTSTTQEEYPQVDVKTPNEVVINFTDPTPYRAPAPAASGTNPDNNPTPPTQPPVPDDHPLANLPTSPPADTPSAGSTNGSGEVYDPVFGWVRPGRVEQTEIDSPGDPNKMVGSMN